MTVRARATLLLAALLVHGCAERPSPKPAAVLQSGPVPLLRIVDGDTLIVLADLGGVELPVRVRLLDIDTPERGEPGFEEATEALRARLHGGPVILRSTDHRWRWDRYGRLLAHASPAQCKNPEGE